MTPRPPLWTLAFVLVACSSPPEAPTVDDTVKRPLNNPQLVQLRQCTTQLKAAEIVLTETLHERTTTRTYATPAANTVVVVPFALGATEFRLPADVQPRFVEQARSAGYIVIRGRTDAATDSASEARVARLRAESAARFLVTTAQVPLRNIRVTWQGAGDPAEDVAVSPVRRRVEIEFYPTRPTQEVVAVAAR